MSEPVILLYSDEVDSTKNLFERRKAASVENEKSSQWEDYGAGRYILPVR